MIIRHRNCSIYNEMNHKIKQIGSNEANHEIKQIGSQEITDRKQEK